MVITDTVGLIKDLPKDLMGAFRPTFDELRESTLIIHLIDINDIRFPEHIESVERILSELKLDHIPRLRVFNKEDKLSVEEGKAICQKYAGVCISALRPESLEKLFFEVDKKLWEVDMTLSRQYQTTARWDPVRLTNKNSFDIPNQAG
jgi:GTP-binding protein HflX